MRVFDEIKEKLTVETLAPLLVKTIIVDNTEPMYLSQLDARVYDFTPSGYKKAVDNMVSVLNTELKEGEKKNVDNNEPEIK